MTLDARTVTERGDGTIGVTIASQTPTNQTANPSTDAALLTTEFSVRPSAPGVAVVPQYTGAAPINDSVGPFLMQIPRRTCRIVLGVGGANPVNFHITGVLLGGQVVTEDIVATGPGTYEGYLAFGEVTSFTSDETPVGTVDLQTGKGFGICLLPVTSVDQSIGVDGVVEQAVYFSSNALTIVPVTAPNGTRVFTYRVVWSHIHTTPAHTHIQNAHTHTATIT